MAAKKLLLPAALNSPLSTCNIEEDIEELLGTIPDDIVFIEFYDLTE